MEIYESIREIRLQKGINQQAIADALNVDVSVASNIEKGKRDLRVRELEIIANVLGIPVIDLFTYPDKYVRISQTEEDNTEVLLQIRLKKNKKDQILGLVFGENNIEILNK